MVQRDPFKGQRLCDEDLARLAKLKCLKKDPFPLKDCAICECNMQVQCCSFRSGFFYCFVNKKMLLLAKYPASVLLRHMPPY